MIRICIYPKDIQMITGRSERQGRNILIQIRKKLNKEKHQAITVEEFCTHMGLNTTEVTKLLR